jgi:hypothetical protein
MNNMIAARMMARGGEARGAGRDHRSPRAAALLP